MNKIRLGPVPSPLKQKSWICHPITLAFDVPIFIVISCKVPIFNIVLILHPWWGPLPNDWASIFTCHTGVKGNLGIWYNSEWQCWKLTETHRPDLTRSVACVGVSGGTQQCEKKKTGTSLSLHWLITDESPIALHVSSPAIGGQRTAPDQPIIERVPRNGSCIRPSRHEQKAVSWRKRKATETQQPQTTSVSESRPIPLQGPVCNIIPTVPSYPRPFLCLYWLVPFICHWPTCL